MKKLLINGTLLLVVVFASIFVGMKLARYLDKKETVEKQEVKQGSKTVRMLEVAQGILSFRLVDHHGKPFRRKHLKGKWTIMFFGYISCPDVCPREMALISEMVKTLESRFELGITQVVFVSIDPKRDTSKRLAEYVPYFHKDFLGVTGKVDQLQKLGNQLGAAWQIIPPKKDQPGFYTVDHTASIYIIDHFGRLVAEFPPPHDVTTMVDDFLEIRYVYEDTYTCTY